MRSANLLCAERRFPRRHPSLKRTLLLLLVVAGPHVSGTQPFAQDTGLQNYIDLNALRAADSNWQVVQQNITHDSGRLKLRNLKWLMFFLHWRPLDKGDTSLTFDYARDHLLNFWGESMPFELSGTQRQVSVCGHRAIVTEGSIYEGRIATRFVVWNCPATGRQLTADCNINLARGTPRHLLDIQERIAATVQCHPPLVTARHEALPNRYLSDKWNLGFSTPENWHTEEYPSAEWFPNGMDVHNGSLWTLLEDSDKRVDLKWEVTEDEISESRLRSLLAQLPQDSAVLHDSSITLTVAVDTVARVDDYYVGRGSYRYDRTVQGQDYQSTYRFHSLLWKRENRAFFLIASMAAIDAFWGLPVDLVPSDERMDAYLWQEVIPNVNVLAID